ncbi:hypothetical protein CANCADRAFT_32092 [Tortispora caseinolytica NRRL Y-17796]|uniref:Uncharacterized protein n=1 Tax=Tortispora caseinolytica NRRL Y-17796 TaxID=767744 RepID=A0A1E4TA36_9ASCO|nr:hypothetical protein CANCADRAFT_32092 [Tortispora caseinolytica NRRL Y-17796]
MQKETKIKLLLALDFAFFLVELISGYTVHSLALVADAFHMLNDIISLLVALWAVRLAKSSKAPVEYTYGWQRAEILGALLNGVFLVALCLSIFLEALERLINPPIVTNPLLILCVGSAGLVSNLLGLVLFHDHDHGHGHGPADHDHEAHREEGDAVDPPVWPEDVVQQISESLEDEQDEETSGLMNNTSNSQTYGTVGSSDDDLEQATHKYHFHTISDRVSKKKKGNTKSLNMQGVFLHVMGDALGNVGVIAAALVIWHFKGHWKYYMDPLISLFITAIILSSAIPLCKTTSKILLQATPKGFKIKEVEKDILSLDGIESVHDLHVWILRENYYICSLHATVSIPPKNFMKLAQEIRSCLHAYGVHSATIQPEFVCAALQSEPSSCAFSCCQNPTPPIEVSSHHH